MFLEIITTIFCFVPCISWTACMLPLLHFPPCYVADIVPGSHYFHIPGTPAPCCFLLSAMSHHILPLVVWIEMESFLAASPTCNCQDNNWSLPPTRGKDLRRVRICTAPKGLSCPAQLSALCTAVLHSSQLAGLSACSFSAGSTTMHGEPCKDQRSGQASRINPTVPAEITILCLFISFTVTKGRLKTITCILLTSPYLMWPIWNSDSVYPHTITGREMCVQQKFSYHTG